MTKNITATRMIINLIDTTGNETDIKWFADKVIYYLDNKDYSDKMKRIFIEAAYVGLMVRIALETISDQEERAIFYIENGIIYETAKTIEEAILPLLEKYKREDK